MLATAEEEKQLSFSGQWNISMQPEKCPAAAKEEEEVGGGAKVSN